MGEFEGFEWDEKKSERCFRERALDFRHAINIFEGTCVEREDRRVEYGEARFITIGEVGGRILTVIWTPRGTVRRIISARAASKRERKSFYGTRENH
jgi:uncharacterized DUF497 family protein